VKTRPASHPTQKPKLKMRWPSVTVAGFLTMRRLGSPWVWTQKSSKMLPLGLPSAPVRNAPKMVLRRSPSVVRVMLQLKRRSPWEKEVRCLWERGGEGGKDDMGTDKPSRFPLRPSPRRAPLLSTPCHDAQLTFFVTRRSRLGEMRGPAMMIRKWRGGPEPSSWARTAECLRTLAWPWAEQVRLSCGSKVDVCSAGRVGSGGLKPVLMPLSILPSRKTPPAYVTQPSGIAIGADVTADQTGLFIKPVRDVDPTVSTTTLFSLYYNKDTGEITYDDTDTRRQLSEDGAGADGDEATIKALQDKVGAQDARIRALEERIEALLQR
jgi:hypothetical protein